MSTVRARLAIALAALAASGALAACGGDDKTPASDAAATTATAPAGSAATTQQSGEDSTTKDDSGEDSGSPESRIAPDAQVSSGLTRLKGVAATVAAAGGGAGARDAVEKVWQPIEGTVKRNEPDLYLDVEDSFALLSAGGADKARQGEQRLDQAIDAYLAKHPG